MTLHATGIADDPLAPVARLAEAIAARLVGHERLVERLAIGVLAGGAVADPAPCGRNIRALRAAARPVPALA